MAELEAKQGDILKQLAKLKEQIYTLKCDLNIQNDSSSKEIHTAQSPRLVQQVSI